MKHERTFKTWKQRIENCKKVEKSWKKVERNMKENKRKLEERWKQVQIKLKECWKNVKRKSKERKILESFKTAKKSRNIIERTLKER